MNKKNITLYLIGIVFPMIIFEFVYRFNDSGMRLPEWLLIKNFMNLRDGNIAEGKLMEKPRTTKHHVMSFFNGLPPAVIFDRLRQYSNRCLYMSQIFPARQNNKSENNNEPDFGKIAFSQY